MIIVKRETCYEIRFTLHEIRVEDENRIMMLTIGIF